MASRFYVPRHSAVPAPTGPGARRTVTAVATSVGAAAVATTALAAPADAKSSHHTVWDRVASCESGQRWHIATGNGYYGGLQFSSSTWAAYNGHTYAQQASGASRDEQIEVARRVLHSQGPGAWPVCGPRAGLTMQSGDATGAHLPAVAGGGPRASRHTTHRVSTPSTGARRKNAHRKHHHGAKRRTHGRLYVVHAGDTLSAIATRFHVHGGWHAIYRANRAHLHNPNVLRIGQRLLLP